MGAKIQVRETTGADEAAIHAVHVAAFGTEEGRVVGDLTIALLLDPTAQPLLSLLAWDEDTAVGHVLFTRVSIDGAPEPVRASILAPLAVLPDRQKDGIGSELTRHGLAMLTEDRYDLVFVLGHPSYYPRFGFHPAGRLGLAAPYPIPEKNSDAWMALELREGRIGTITGTVRCAQALDKPEYWVE